MTLLDRILGREPTLEQLLEEAQKLGREADELRERRRALKQKIDKILAERAPKDLPAGVIAKGD